MVENRGQNFEYIIPENFSLAEETYILEADHLSNEDSNLKPQILRTSTNNLQGRTDYYLSKNFAKII